MHLPTKPAVWTFAASSPFLLCAWVMLGAASARAQADRPSSAPSPKALQQRAFRLWNLGRTEEGIGLLEQLARAHPDLREGKTAFVHLASWFENSLIVEAESLDEVTENLDEARQYFRRALGDVGEQEAYLSREARTGLERIEAKRGVVERIQSGEIEVGRGAELLGDMEASRAAAAHMRASFDPESENAAQHIHLELVHQTDYLDAMYLKLEGIVKLTDEDDPGGSTFGFTRYGESVDEAARESIVSSTRATELFPDSERALDYLIYRGDAYGYLGGLDELRQVAAEAGVIGSDGFRSNAREHFESALAAYETLLAEVDRRIAESNKLLDERLDEPLGRDRETLARYRDFALDGIRNQRALTERTPVTSR